MCQHNKQFEEWWAQQVDNGGEWTTLERLAAKDAWEAATKLVEEKFTSTNSAMDAICPNCDGTGEIIYTTVLGNRSTECLDCDGTGKQ